jgi:glutamate-1-semialdehyde 2,1-aminomutase
MYIVGGEPLLIQRHYEFLDSLISKGIAGQMTLEYNSNITTIPERAWNLWRHFGQVSVGASMDGVGAVNDYIRHPSRFASVAANLHKLDVAEGNFRIRTSTTVSVFNILHLTEFLKWKLEQNFKRVTWPVQNALLACHPLHSPNYLSIQILPPLAKVRVAEKFADFQIWLRGWVQGQDFSEKRANALVEASKDLLEGYLKLLNARDLSYLIPQFKCETQELDRLRRESFAQTFPELNQFIEGVSDARAHNESPRIGN